MILIKRLMKKSIYFVITLAVLLSSCKTNALVKPNIEENDYFGSTSEPEEAPITEEDNESSITLILLNTVSDINDTLMGMYMSQLLSEVGFDVKAKFFRFDYMDVSGSEKEYEKMVREEIEKGGNVVFEYKFDIKDMINDGLVLNLGTGQEDYLISVGDRETYTYTGIYINNELEEAYGNQIDSIREYTKFLEWVKSYKPEMTPGLFLSDITTYEKHLPLAFFAQANGFVRADYALGCYNQNGGNTFYIDLQDISKSTETVPMVYPATMLPFFEEMNETLIDWRNKGYMKIKEKGSISRLDDYASIVMSMQGQAQYYSYDYQNMDYRLLDLSEYNLHIITNDKLSSDNPNLKRTEGIYNMVISSNSPSSQTILDLFNWIYASQENYKYFMYGKEGVDYSIYDGRVSFKSNKLNIFYGLWHKHTMFLDSDYDLLMPHFPANWSQIMENLNNTQNTSIVKTIGYENINCNINDVVRETISEASLKNAYFEDVGSKFERYFNDVINGGEYNLNELLDDLNSSQVTTDMHNAYNELLYMLYKE